MKDNIAKRKKKGGQDFIKVNNEVKFKKI